MTKTTFERTVLATVAVCTFIILICSTNKSTSEASTSKQPIPFCTILPSSIEFVSKYDTVPFVGARGFYWNKHSTLRIYFYNGTEDVIQKVLNIANTWASLSSLQFKRVLTQNPSEIRVSFRCPGYNSLVAKQAYDPSYNGQPTMCLEGLDQTSDKNLFVRTVLHEFGHVMGLLHELQNPGAQIPWDTARLYAYYDSVYHWKPDSVNKYVLNLYLNADVDVSQFDQSSIMMYAIPKQVTKGGYSVQWPNRLSKMDTAFLIETYH